MAFPSPDTESWNLGSDVEQRAGPRLSISRFLSHRSLGSLKPGRGRQRCLDFAVARLSNHEARSWCRILVRGPEGGRVHGEMDKEELPISVNGFPKLTDRMHTNCTHGKRGGGRYCG